MNREQTVTAIQDLGAVAVIRAESEEKAFSLIEQCAEGGLSNIELTFTGPFAHRVIEHAAMRYGKEILLGAGSVLDSETARIALLSGAEFIVSPHFDGQLVRLCNRYRKPSVCGIMTVTEAVSAMEAGCDMLKLFPSEVLGPSFLKALRGPLPFAKLMPTGGVNAHNAGEWIKAGAAAVGAGGSLLQGNVSRNAQELLAAVRRAREEQA